MSVLQIALLALCALLLLWLSFKIAKAAFRILRCIIPLALAVFLVWYFFLR
jgi:hypothetical protein